MHYVCSLRLEYAHILYASNGINIDVCTCMNRCIVDHIYALRIENTGQTDPHSYEATKAVAKNAQKTF